MYVRIKNVKISYNYRKVAKEIVNLYTKWYESSRIWTASLKYAITCGIVIYLLFFFLRSDILVREFYDFIGEVFYIDRAYVPRCISIVYLLVILMIVLACLICRMPSGEYMSFNIGYNKAEAIYKYIKSNKIEIGEEFEWLCGMPYVADVLGKHWRIVQTAQSGKSPMYYSLSTEYDNVVSIYSMDSRSVDITYVGMAKLVNIEDKDSGKELILYLNDNAYLATELSDIAPVVENIEG